MRPGLMCLGLVLVAVAAHGQRNKDDDAAAAKRACSVEECFFERDVRDFEIIDQTHLIVYTGPQRCVFHIEVRGTLCDLTFAPELYFSRIGEMPDGGSATAGAIADPFGPAATSRQRRDLRICTNDLNIQVHGGQFTESVSANAPPDRFGNPRTNCQISTVESITDDQLIEFYVGRGVVPPLPPMGAGEIEVGEQDEEEDNEKE
jgi:hypothetical protein